jgi:hypothetical protein
MRMWPTVLGVAEFPPAAVLLTRSSTRLVLVSAATVLVLFAS